jgi:glycosyltransferase involved in cell wall biosynthesis
MRICLNMIVRDEAPNLPRLFASVQGVADCFVVSDTGSRDGTRELLDVLSERYGIPGIVTSDPWVDFSTNRNLALDAALQAQSRGVMRFDWLMVIDADEELVVNDPSWRSSLSPGNSHVAYKRGRDISFQHDLLLWVEGRHWNWEGGVHAYVRNALPGHRSVHIDSLAIAYGDFTGAKTRSFANPMEKAQADVSRLEAELGSEPAGSDNVHRFFQLAYAYRNTGDIAGCLRTMQAVADSPHSGKELTYAALVVAGQSISEMEDHGSKAIECFERAMRIDGQRWEAPYHLAVSLRRKKEPGRARELLESRHAMGYTDKGLYWKEHPVYEWRLAYELCFLRSLTGDGHRVAEWAEPLLASGRLPAVEEGFLRQLLNLSSAAPSIDESGVDMKDPGIRDL